MADAAAESGGEVILNTFRRRQIAPQNIKKRGCIFDPIGFSIAGVDTQKIGPSLPMIVV